MVSSHSSRRAAGIAQIRYPDIHLTRDLQNRANFLENLQDAFFMVDKDWRFTYINRKGFELIGLDRSKTIGKTLWELWPGYEGTPTGQLFREAMQSGKPTHGKFVGYYHEQFYEVDIYPSAEGLGAILADKTELREQLEELKKSEEQLVGFLESTNDSFFALDMEWKFLYANQHFYSLMKREGENLTGRDFWSEFPRYKDSQIEPHYRQAMKKRVPVKFETGGIYAQGALAVTIYPIRQGIAVFYTDRTEEKAAMEKVRQLNEDLQKRNAEVEQERRRWQSLVEAIADEVWVCDLQGNISLVSGAKIDPIFQKGYINASWDDILQEVEVLTPEGKVRPREETPVLVSLSGKIYTGEEIIRHRQTGKVAYRQFSSAPLYDENGKIIGAVAVAHDISEEKRIQDELQGYAARLQQSNQELTDFAFIASHDLQEPLRKVLTFGSSLYDELNPKLDERQDDRFMRMLNASRRMSEMIQSLLELSRVTTQGQPFQPVDLQKLVQDVVADMEVTIVKNRGKVEFSNLPQIQGDAIQIQRLFMNLIGNGLKYHRPEAAPVITITANKIREKDAEKVEIKVIDNGIGFEMQHAGRIFQPFIRLNSQTQFSGTGMGLAISKRIVERHGGRIFAESKPGEGSTFTVILPAR